MLSRSPLGRNLEGDQLTEIMEAIEGVFRFQV
jgi:hypothetical protein